MNEILEQLQEYWPQYLISNTIAIVVLFLAWKKPTAGRIGLGVIFLLASIVNTVVAITNPADYLDYSRFTVLDIYRRFIEGWFADYIRPMVLSIAAGQLCIALGMFFGGRLLKTAIIGTVIFGLAIAPLGIASAFPCSVLLAIAAWMLWTPSTQSIQETGGKGQEDTAR